jgi:hypothetical protein
MEFTDYLSHQWKAFIRNERWRRGLFSRILFILLIAYFLLLAVAFSLNMNYILKSIGGHPVDTFNKILLWYFAVDLLMRSIFQPLPSIQIIPYLRLNILRGSIIRNLLYKSIWNVFNLLPLIIFTSFTLKILPEYYSGGISLFYMATILSFIMLNNFIAMLLGYLSQKNIIFFLIPIVLIGIFSLLQVLGFSVSNLSVTLGKSILQGNVFIILSGVLLLIVSLYVSFKLLRSNFYLDTISSRQMEKKFGLGMDKLSAWGEMGSYLLLEINLFMRNKRPRQSLLILPLLVIYFLFSSTREMNKGVNMGLFMILMCIGLGAAIYGQFMFSWESSYFDGLMARKLNFKRYILVKYYIMCALSTLVFIPFFIMYVMQGKIEPYTLVSFYLFTMGIVTFMVMWFATFNNGRIDLSRSQMFNYQGIKGSQFILSFVIMLIPFGLFLLIKYLTDELIASIIFSSVGLLFISTHQWWIQNIIIRRFIARKYSNMEGYRAYS